MRRSTFPVSPLPQSQWQKISLLQDLLSSSANSTITRRPTHSVLARKPLVCSLPPSASMPVLVLTNILSAGVPADWRHEAILGNLKTNVDYLPPPPPPVWSSRILRLSSLGTDRPFHSGPISLIYWQLLPSLISGLNCMYIYTIC